MKLCIWCLVEKPMDEFYRNANAEDDKQSYCIACKTAYDIFIKQCVNVSVKAGKLAGKRHRDLIKQKHELERKIHAIDVQIQIDNANGIVETNPNESN